MLHIACFFMRFAFAFLYIFCGYFFFTYFFITLAIYVSCLKFDFESVDFIPVNFCFEICAPFFPVML